MTTKKEDLSLRVMNTMRNQKVTRIRSAGKIKACFHPTKTECTKTIVDAHSLQRQGVLTTLEENDKGNKYLYLHTEREYTKRYEFADLKKVGRAAVGTFHGFCSFHDNKIFEPIEKIAEITDVKNKEHCFLHSYRAIAMALHRKREELKILSSRDPKVIKLVHENFKGRQLLSKISSVRKSLRESTKTRERVNSCLLEKQFDALKYLTFDLPYTIPMACSNFGAPHQMPSGKIIRYHDFKPENCIAITILPYSGRSVIILATFPENNLGLEFFEEISNLQSIGKKQRFLSFFVLQMENVVIAPLYLDSKSPKKREEYVNTIEWVSRLTVTNSQLSINNGNCDWHINYFKKANSLQRLRWKKRFRFFFARIRTLLKGRNDI